MKKLKKILILSSLLIIAFSFVGCGKKKTALTKDNINDYLKIKCSSSGEIEYVSDGKSMGQYVGHYEGEITKTFKFINQKNISFEDVSINIECKVSSLMHQYDLKFKDGGTKGVYQGSTGEEFTEYTKLITVTLPYDCSEIEKTVEIEVENIEDIVSVTPGMSTALDHFDWEIVDVTGSVVEN